MTLKVGFNADNGFIGTKVSSATSFQCTNFDKLLILFKNGTYKIINPPEKEYLGCQGKDIVYVGIADKKTVFSVVSKDNKSKVCYGKRFVVSKFILSKVYRFFDEDHKLEFITSHPHTILSLEFAQKARQKVKSLPVDLATITIKGVSTKGIRLSPKEVKKVKNS